MHKTIITIASLLLITTMAAFMQTSPTRIIFFGDSITEMGVQEHGYISRIRSLAAESGLSGKFEFIGAGIGGNKVYDLYLRLENDVLAKKPDVVFIYVGINDIWHKRLAGTGTDVDKFELFYIALIKKLKAAGIKPVLCTPSVIGERTDSSNEQDGELNHYSNIIRRLASDNGLALVDLRKAFLQHYTSANPQNLEKGILTTDRVHLNDAGNNLVAREMWKTISTLQ